MVNSPINWSFKARVILHQGSPSLKDFAFPFFTLQFSGNAKKNLDNKEMKNVTMLNMK